MPMKDYIDKALSDDKITTLEAISLMDELKQSDDIKQAIFRHFLKFSFTNINSVYALFIIAYHGGIMQGRDERITNETKM